MAKNDTVKHFYTDRDRFIGGVFRKGGDPEGFALDVEDTPKKLPEGMRLMTELTPSQKQAKAETKKAKVKEAEEQDKEFASVGAGTGAPDFMDADDTKQGKVTVL